MSIQDIIYSKIKEEIEKDPFNIGYAGKTDEEIMMLLNNSIQKSTTNYYSEQPPITRILSGIGYAPNVISQKDVTDSRIFVDIK